MSWWEKIADKQILQGDLIDECHVPIVPAEWTPRENEVSGIGVEVRKLIVLTQSCDLMQGKVNNIAACPVASLAEYAEVNPHFKTKKNWDAVRMGRQPALHMLSSPLSPTNNEECLLVDFREIFNLPLPYVQRLCPPERERFRLKSPYLEHMAQAFARFFMRVGLPNDIPKFE